MPANDLKCWGVTLFLLYTFSAGNNAQTGQARFWQLDPGQIKRSKFASTRAVGEEAAKRNNLAGVMRFECK